MEQVRTLLALTLLAQAPDQWVKFDLCQLDFSQRPPVASRHRDHGVFVMRADLVHAIIEIRPEPTGIDCMQIGSTGGYTIFVIGTLEEIQRKVGAR